LRDRAPSGVVAITLLNSLEHTWRSRCVLAFGRARSRISGLSKSHNFQAKLAVSNILISAKRRTSPLGRFATVASITAVGGIRTFARVRPPNGNCP
jgi:hypothetical protein